MAYFPEQHYDSSKAFRGKSLNVAPETLVPQQKPIFEKEAHELTVADIEMILSKKGRGFLRATSREVLFVCEYQNQTKVFFMIEMTTAVFAKVMENFQWGSTFPVAQAA